MHNIFFCEKGSWEIQKYFYPFAFVWWIKTKWNFSFYRKDFSNDSAEALIYFTFEITLYPKGWRFNFHSSYILLSGAPSAEFLDSPVTAMDHPFLKALQASSSPETLTDGNEIRLRNILDVENKNID